MQFSSSLKERLKKCGRYHPGGTPTSSKANTLRTQSFFPQVATSKEKFVSKDVIDTPNSKRNFKAKALKLDTENTDELNKSESKDSLNTQALTNCADVEESHDERDNEKDLSLSQLQQIKADLQSKLDVQKEKLRKLNMVKTYREKVN